MILHCNVLKVTGPKRGKRSASFMVTPISYTSEGNTIQIKGNYYGYNDKTLKSILGYSSGTEGELACVCQLQGYKNASATTMTTIQNPTKYVYSGMKNGKCLQMCQQAPGITL